MWGYDLRIGSVIVKIFCFFVCIGYCVWWVYVFFFVGKGMGRFEMIFVIIVVGLLDIIFEKKSILKIYKKYLYYLFGFEFWICWKYNYIIYKLLNIWRIDFILVNWLNLNFFL